MKTLLVYYSNNKKMQEMCEASAKSGDVDVVRLYERYNKGLLWDATIGTCRAIGGIGSKFQDIDINMAEYDNLIIATPVRLLNPHSVINEFLHRTSLMDVRVSALLIHTGGIIGAAADILRKRIYLAGGCCRGVVSISTRELKEKKCDAVSLAKVKTKVPVTA
ncbi:MAG TPA: hypothetical protein VFD52_02510 [Clostridia bacterium]|nr:hypothetical protein [Clostridia bacterium]